MTATTRNLRFYESSLAQWMDTHDGQFVVIRDASARSFFDTYEAALTWAYDNFGLSQFFVKKIERDQDVAHFTRDVGQCS